MSRKIIETFWSWYNSGIDRTEIRALIECDTMTDLPSPDAISGYRLTIGTTAHVIDTNALYMMQSGGAWKVQSAGTDVYTKAETDALIQDSKDYADGLIAALDVSSVGGTTRYIYQISETNGKISASSYASDTTPTAGSTKLIQSGGVKTYVDAETTARQAECNVLANAGAKNLCPYNTASTAVANRAVIDDQPINLSAGTYIISYTQTATSGSSSIKFSYNGTAVLTFPISNDSNLEKEAEFTLPSAANQIKLFTNVVNSYSNIMIRRKEITDATYQPYAPTNRELYEMILAL